MENHFQTIILSGLDFLVATSSGILTYKYIKKRGLSAKAIALMLAGGLLTGLVTLAVLASIVIHSVI